MERQKNFHGSVHGQDERQTSDYERTGGVTGSTTEQGFPRQMHDHQQEVGYDRQHHHGQHRTLQTSYRSSGQQQLSTDAIRTTAPASPQPHCHHHHHHQHHPTQDQQHQLLPGRHYFINDLLSSTAAPSSISPPDLAIASSMQLLNGKSSSCYLSASYVIMIIRLCRHPAQTTQRVLNLVYRIQKPNRLLMWLWLFDYY